MSHVTSNSYVVNVYDGADLRDQGIPLETSLRMGREAANEIVLQHIGISRHHATLELDGSIVLFTDEKSKNGCLINGEKLSDDTIEVSPTDVIEIGPFRIELVETTLSSILARPFDASPDELEETILVSEPLGTVALADKKLSAVHEFVSDKSASDIDTLCQRASDCIRQCFPFKTLCILLAEDGRSSTHASWDEAGRCRVDEVSIYQPIVDRCLTEQIAILLDDDLAPSFAPADAESPGSIACAPLTCGEQRLGVIYVSSSSKQPSYSQAELDLLIMVGGILGTHLAHLGAIDELESEKEMVNAILGNLHDAILVTDAALLILSANTSAQRMFNGAELLGRNLVECLREFEYSYDLTRVSEKSTFRVERPAERSESLSSSIPSVYSVSVSENHDTHDNWRFVFCFHDVSQVQHMARLKSLLVNRLAHKLLSPLTIISGVHTMVTEQANRVQDPELVQLLEASQESSERCVALVQEFLEYTRVAFAPGLGLLDSQRVSLGDFVGTALESLTETVDAKGFNVTLADGADLYLLEGDRDRLQLAFTHLIQNAVKFGKKNGQLDINAAHEDGRVTVSFADDGPGIPEEATEHLGSLLYQVDEENTGEVPGAGLGLWFVNEIVRCHGGEVTITSPSNRDGTGTLIKIVVPGALVNAASLAGS